MAARSFPLWLLAVGFLAAAHAQEPPKPSYAALLEQVKKADPGADFLKLRLAFTATAGYKPYDVGRKARADMEQALEQKEYARAAEVAEKVLRANYVDMKAHFIAYRAYTELKKSDEAALHRRVFDGLVRSILKCGDGKTPASAFVVIATDEEYAVLGVLGIRRTAQALMGEKGEKFDRIDGVDGNTGDRVTLFFNITRQFRWLENQFKKGD